jgi:hypothetical protein
MKFYERYKLEQTWQGKVIIMEIYHLAMSQIRKGWTIQKTANNFHCSIGLVSENLRIADALHTEPDLLNCESRQNVLSKIDRRKYESTF